MEEITLCITQWKKKNGTLKIKTGDLEMQTKLTEMKEDKRKKKNFKFESTNNSAFLGKFMGLFAE